jgi:hypothetical protein
MAYVAPVFLEHSMSEDQKLTALNALETQYDEGIAYIDAYMHDARYYTETEMDAANYKGPDHPDGRSDTGHGCGVNAATVDGYSLAAIRAQALPPGCITFWTGSLGTIPSSWDLFDDGKGKFILAAGISYEVDDENNIDYVTPECIAGFTSDGTALSGTAIAKHVHTLTDKGGAEVSGFAATGATNACKDITAGAAESTTTVDNIANTTSEEHTHDCTFTFTGYYDENNVLHNGALDLYPKFKALCWVIKL